MTLGAFLFALPDYYQEAPVYDSPGVPVNQKPRCR